MAVPARTRLIIIAAFVLAAGAANAADAVEQAAPPDPGRAVLLSLEKSAYEAWKSHDAKFWDSFLSEKFVGWGSSGRLDKASAAREFTGADCAIKSYAISDAQMSPLGADAALLTHKTNIDGNCGGQKLQPGSWAASVYVRDGQQWKAAFHAEAAIVDPTAPPKKPAGGKAGLGEKQTTRADGDVVSDALLQRERAAWDAWKDHDTRRMDGLIARNVQFINIFGTHLATRADALKNWSGKGCEVKTVRLSDARATMLSPTVGILTFHARADGTCFGQKVGPVWGSSVYVKDGATWNWTFGINLPARPQGA